MSSEPLRKYRERVGISQLGLSQWMGLSLRQYQDLESGAAPMRDIHRYAHDDASERIALDVRYDTRALTANKVQRIVILGPRLTAEDLARGGLVETHSLWSTMSSQERRVIEEMQTCAGRALSKDELIKLLEVLRALAVDRSPGQIKLG